MFILEGFLQHLIDLKKFDTTGKIVIDENSPLRLGLKNLNRYFSLFEDLNIINWSNISTVLGNTIDFLLIDLRKEFNPNKINILFETVRGGGIILILGLERNKWIYSVNESLFLSETNLENKTASKKSILLEWFLTNINKNTQCVTNKVSVKDIIQSFNPMPFSEQLKDQFQGILVTTEQKEVINNIIREFDDEPHYNSCSVLVANRGRGKSSSVGLALAYLAFKRKKKAFKAAITSPHLENAQIIFQFILLGLKSQQIKYNIKKQDKLIYNIIISSKVKFLYYWPSEILKDKRIDVFVVDEAAALPLDILKRIIKGKTKKILISTIHGYEGAGRGFQYKILRYLANQTKIKYYQNSLSHPIRYLQSDKIEKLINDSFLLDVELEPFNETQESINSMSIRLIEYNDSEYLFSERGLPDLRLNFGILINAHYRNQPNDLLLLADSRNHFLVGLYGQTEQKKKKILVSTQLAKEGEMKNDIISSIASGVFIPGHLIPAVAIRHFSKDFAKLKGLRIVRIAVHPDLVDKGLGRLAISLQIERFSTYDWIGVSYGATVRLVKFWKKIGFKAVHIRPIMTPETGEWNLVVVRPISESAVEIIDAASADFLLQFIALLKQSLYSMQPELVVEIIRNCSYNSNYEPRITSSGEFRLKNYLKGNLNFLLAVDVFYEIVVYYFVTSSSINLSPSQEALLITRILQGRTWNQTLSITGLNWKIANGLLEKAILKLANLYLEKN